MCGFPCARSKEACLLSTLLAATAPIGGLQEGVRSGPHGAAPIQHSPGKRSGQPGHPPQAEGEQTSSGQGVCRAQLVSGSPLFLSRNSLSFFYSLSWVSGSHWAVWRM